MADNQILHSLYNEALSIGIVNNQYAFSRLCGRKHNWYSCAKSIGRKISLGVMITLAVKLDHLDLSYLPPAKRQEAKFFAKSIWQQVEAEIIGPPAQDDEQALEIAGA
jgi:hypothetical protein